MMPITLPSSESKPGTKGRSLGLTAARGSRNLIVIILDLASCNIAVRKSCRFTFIRKLALDLQPATRRWFALTGGGICISSNDGYETCNDTLKRRDDLAWFLHTRTDDCMARISTPRLGASADPASRHQFAGERRVGIVQHRQGRRRAQTEPARRRSDLYRRRHAVDAGARRQELGFSLHRRHTLHSRLSRRRPNQNDRRCEQQATLRLRFAGQYQDPGPAQRQTYRHQPFRQHG